MADKSLPPENLPTERQKPGVDERRAFLKKAAAIGIPVVIATLPGRPAFAGGWTTPNQTGSACASLPPSQCAGG